MLDKVKISGFADEIHSDIRIQVKLLKELGIKYLELRSAEGKNISECTPEEAKELKKFLEENQLKVSAIGSPVGKILITDDFEPHFETYKKVVEAAKIMETPYIRIFSFFIPEEEKADSYKDQVFERMNRFIEYAITQDVILLHENEKDIYGDTATRCRQLFENFYGDHFKCTFDFANFVQCKEDTLKAYELLKPYVEYVHIKDASFKTGEVMLPGEGDGNVKEILYKLAETQYEGFLSLEPHLTDFAALKSLEKNVMQRSRTDGEETFSAAHGALVKILNGL